MTLRYVAKKFKKNGNLTKDRNFFELLRMMRDDKIVEVSKATGISATTLRKWFRTDEFGTRSPIFRTRMLIAAAYGYRLEMIPDDGKNTSKRLGK